MAKLYKLTDSCGKTWGGTQWGPGVSHSGTGEGELCGPGWIHAYEHPLIAVLMNPIHADIKNPRLWEAEGEVGLRDGRIKCGCKTLTTVREIPLPSITTEMRVRFAILCAKEVYADLSWNAWADRWLSGEDRSKAAAGAASEAAWAAAWAGAWVGAWAAEAAEAAEAAAYRSARAAGAAGAAAEAAARAGTDIFAIAENACSGVHTFRASRVITSTTVASSTFSSRNKPRRRKTMSKQDDQDFGVAVTLICALVLAFLFMCCAIKTVLDKQHRPAVKASEEVTTTEERE